MANKERIEIEMAFKADTQTAKKQLADLQKSLQDIAAMPGSAGAFFDDKQIQRASKAAMELSQHLRNSMNFNTGKLDVSKLAMNLKTAGKSIKDYRQELILAGKDGQQAFNNLANSIANAEVPTLGLSKTMSDFLTTLKNTAKWQLTSGIVHGLVGGLNKAVGYAKDLDQSLNNIRIVSGQTSDQMVKFAKEANAAAKALSTSTTAYTDASLIFYQQGLSGDAVKERTNAVIKMSNVTGESVEDVSSYMTAIWNNFADGSKSLESFADTITALGASTASSSEEIASGLEKFASIGQTVGLSYEYATSALATVVAETRQSAEVVGTSFRTIFSRLQGLTLGETLEDGVDLNKYSKALNAVGVSVLDATGNMRKLDNILDDLAGKWAFLSSAQQTALAQTVAGTRQYSQLIALMNNWDKMTDNLNTANNAGGSLQKQADIYAESWEASEKRVRAAAESIYDTLINADSMKSINNFLSNVLDGINGIIKGAGGLQGIIMQLLSLFTSKMANEVPVYLNKLKSSFDIITGRSKNNISNIQSEAISSLEESAKTAPTNSEKLEYNGLALITRLKNQVLLTENLTDVEKNQANAQIDNLQRQINKTIEYEKELENQKKIIDNMIKSNQRLSNNNIQSFREGVSLNNAARKDIDTNLNALPKNKLTEQQLRNSLQSTRDYLKGNQNTVNNSYSRQNNVVDLMKQKQQFEKQYGTDVNAKFTELYKKNETATNLYKNNKSDLNNKIAAENAQKEFEKFNAERAIYEENNRKIQSIQSEITELLSNKNNKLTEYVNNFNKSMLQQKAELEKQFADSENFNQFFDRNRENISDEDLDKLKNENLEEEAATKLYKQIYDNIVQKINTTNAIIQRNEVLNINSNNEKAGKLQNTLTQTGDVAKVKEELQSFLKTQKELNEKTKNSKMVEYYAELEKELEKVNDDAEKLKKILDDIKNNRNVNGVINTDQEQSTQALTENLQAQDDLAAITGNAGAASDFNNQSQAYARQLADQFARQMNTDTAIPKISHDTQFSEVAAQYAALTMSAQGYISTLTNLNNLWDENVSAGQRVSQVMMGLVTVGRLMGAITKANATLEAFTLKTKLKNVTAEEAEAILKAGKTIPLLGTEVALRTALNVVMFAAIAIIGAVAFAIADETAKQKEAADAAEKKAEVTKKANEEAQKELEQVQEMVSAYKDLREEYDNNSGKLQELQNRTYLLCMQYGKESEAIKALSADYQGLDKIMSQVELDAAQKAVEASQNNTQAQLTALKLRAWAEGDVTATDEEGFDLESGGSQRKEFLQELESQFGLKADSTGHIDYDKMMEAIAYQYDDFQALLSKYYQTADPAQQFSKFIANNQSQIDAVRESLDQTKENQKIAFKAELEFEYAGQKFSDAKQYANALNTLINKSLSEGVFENDKEGIKSARTWAQQTLLAIDEEYKGYAQSNSIANSLADIFKSPEATKDDIKYTNIFGVQIADLHATERGLQDKLVEELSSDIDKLSDADKDLLINIQDYLNYVYKDKNFKSVNALFETLAKDFDQYKKYIEKNRIVVSIDAALDTLAEGKELAKEQIQSLFNDTNVINGSNLSAFVGMDKGQKQYSLLMEKLTRQEMLANNSQASEAAANDIKAQIYAVQMQHANSTGLSSARQLEDAAAIAQSSIYSNAAGSIIYDDNANMIDERNDAQKFIDNGGIDKKSLEEIVKLYAEGDNASREFTETEKQAIEICKKYGIDLKELSEQYKLTLDKEKERDLALTSLNKELEEIENNTIDYAKTSEILYNDIESVSKELDNLQSAYQTAEKAIEEYANTGYMSIDTLQALIKLGPEYLQYLVDENGQLATNTDYAKNAAQAQIDLMQAEWEGAAITKLKALATAEASAEELNTFINTYTLTEANYALGESALDAAAKNEALIQSLMSTGATAEQAKTAIENYIKAIKSIDFGKVSANLSSSAGKKKKEVDLIKDEADRYHKLNEELQKNQHLLKLHQTITKNSKGNARIIALKQENEYLSKQRKLRSEIIDTIKQEQSELVGNLSDYGLKASNEGIENYAEVYNKIVAEYRAAQEAYNKSSQDDAAEKAYKIAEKRYNEAKKYLDRYDATIKELQSNEEQNAELLSQMIEKNLEGFKLKFELKIDTQNARKDLANLRKEFDVDFTRRYKSTKEWNKIFKQDTKISNADTEITNTKLNQLDKTIAQKDNIGKEDSKFATLSDYYQGVKDAALEVVEAGKQQFEDVKKTWEELTECYDELHDQLDNVISKYDDINEQLDHNAKLNELLYGTTSKEALDNIGEIYDAKIQTSLDKQRALRDSIQKEQDFINSNIGKLGKDNELILRSQDKMSEYEKQLATEIESYAEDIQTALTNSFNKIKLEMDTQLFGDSLVKVRERWDDARDAAKNYYDDVQKVNKLEKLNRSWDKLKDSTSNTKLQKQITDAQNKQLKQLREKESLSARDVEHAEKELSLLEAQIALENAQENKNTMKLVRDTSGNWTYQYVADLDAVKKAEDDVLNASAELYDSAREKQQAVEEEWLDKYAEYQERRFALDNIRNSDPNKYKEEIEYLDELYTGSDGILTKLTAEAAHFSGKTTEAMMIDLQAMYAINKDSYDNMSKEEQSIIDTMIANNINSFGELRDAVSSENGVYQVITQACEECANKTIETWNSAVDTAIKKISTDPESFENIVKNTYTEIQNAVQGYYDKITESEEASNTSWSNINDRVDELKDTLWKTNRQLKNLLTKFDTIDNYVDAFDAANKQWETLKDKIEEAQKAVVEYSKALEKVKDPDLSHGNNNVSGDQGKKDDNTNNSSNEENEIPETPTYKYYKLTTTLGGHADSSLLKTIQQPWETFAVAEKMAYQLTEKNNKDQGKDFSSPIQIVGYTEDGNHDIVETFGSAEYKKYKNIATFDTGGYTGEWSGGDGRLAMLHPKELVLNADDTVNVLKAVDIIRQINSINDSIASRIASMMSDMNNFKTSIPSMSNATNSENNVFNITAEFPNANNVDEIREAILTLPNLASQYLNRK